jgi:hypothetical protein
MNQTTNDRLASGSARVEDSKTSRECKKGFPPPKEMRYARSDSQQCGALYHLSISASSPYGWGR